MNKNSPNLIILMAIVLVLGITSWIITTNNSKLSNEESNHDTVKVVIDDIEYVLNLENNATTKAFLSMLPVDYDMAELNGNEKYVYLNKSLPTNVKKIEKINRGDVMLFGDNCLVIFYDSFNTNYSYTKIGHIENLPVLNNESIKIKFLK